MFLTPYPISNKTGALSEDPPPCRPKDMLERKRRRAAWRRMVEYVFFLGGGGVSPRTRGRRPERATQPASAEGGLWR